MARPQVPKFGSWDNEEVPYTVYFEKARKGKAGAKIINPNDPQNELVHGSSSAQVPPSRTNAEPVRRRHEYKSNREEGDFRHSPVHHGSDRGVSSWGSSKRAGRQNGDYDNSADESPLQPHYQPRVGGRGNGVSSPPRERKPSESSHGSAPHTPGRSRLEPSVRSSESSEKSAAVPKFGEWDESNPSSADGYTHMFNKVREEKHVGAAKKPIIQDDSLYSNDQYPHKSRRRPKGCLSFLIFRK